MILVGEIIVLYVFLVFIVPRLIVPNYGFKKSSLPEKLPPHFQKILEDLQEKSKTQEAFLRNAYEYIVATYTGGRLKTFIYFLYAFDDPFTHLNGFVQCHIQNYILRALLVKSGYFKDDEIKTQTVFLNFFTHQYLKVKVGNTWMQIDPHTHYLGVPFGKRAIFLV